MFPQQGTSLGNLQLTHEEIQEEAESGETHTRVSLNVIKHLLLSDILRCVGRILEALDYTGNQEKHLLLMTKVDLMMNSYCK